MSGMFSLPMLPEADSIANQGRLAQLATGLVTIPSVKPNDLRPPYSLCQHVCQQAMQQTAICRPSSTHGPA